jgi:hypothetical protein
MAVSKLGTDLRLVLVLVLLVAVGVLSLHSPTPDPPADAGDAVEEQHYQQIRAIHGAMADAYRRGDQAELGRLRARFHQVVTNYACWFRQRNPLPDSPQPQP